MNTKNQNTKVKRELEDWCKYLRKAKNDDYLSYKKKITKFAPKDKEFSRVLVQCLSDILSEQNKFYNYNTDTQKNQDIKALNRLLAILIQRKDISPQESKQILQYVVTDLQQGIQQYLNQVKDSQQVNFDKLNDIWRKVFFIDQRKFWNYVQNDRITDEKLILFYQLCRLNTDINSSNSFYLEYIRLLQNLKWTKELPPAVNYNSKNDVIQMVAYQNCLFLHPRYVEDVTKQIFTLELYLRQKFSLNNLTFQLFGSLRNRTTIINQTDGDISIFFKDLSNFGQLLILQKLKKVMKIQIQQNKSGLDNLRNVYVKIHRISFLKLIYFEPCHNQATFRGNNFHLSTIDLLVNNHHGVKNSAIIAKYTRNQHVMKLCCLTKLWAKNSKLINSEDPRGHLSSYGLNLMTIYYLIRTGQASYVEKQNSYTYVISRASRIKKNLLQNLIGFFQFYAQQSSFHKNKEIVCLMKKFQQRFNPDILINMYDFIDFTNPGRMKVQRRLDFFRFVTRALSVLKEGTISRVQTIFTSRS